MLNPDLVRRIRAIFLHQRPHIEVAEAIELLGWTRREMTDATRGGEIEIMRTAVGEWLWVEEIMAKALERWPLETIEDSLREDADRVMPASMRLVPLAVRIPRHHLEMLEHLAFRR